ncbi:MAG: FtsH protease activity modulator HflK [Rickettsiaceae bacterium]|nr:FtsH protease activity modulator HflK [Rickettsiaceae bacterium]
MIKKITGQIFEKSPWEDGEPEENIFTKKRQKNSNFNLNDFKFDIDKKSIIFIILAIFILWLSSGIYKIQEGQRAAVIRFGQYHRTAMPGLNYHLPAPIEAVSIEKVDESKRIEIGYRSTGASKMGGAVSARDIKAESIMLTGDENIVELHVDVMWHINDLAKYLFNVSSQEATVKSAAESAIREVIGSTLISSVLSNQKEAIANRIEILIQQILDQYELGVTIEQVKLLHAEPPEQVIAAYRDVQTAKADKEKAINESEAYKNDVLPRARGESAKIIEEAEGYKAEVISQSTGNAARFNSLYAQYVLGKDVTKSRLYMEAVESILRNSTKVIMGGEGMLPHMAVNQKNLLEK